MTTATTPGAPAVVGATTPPPERRGYAARYRLLRSKWNEEWWSIAFGGPVGNVLNAVVADVLWITPNTLTLLGFGCKLAICPLLVLGDPRADLVVIALLQLSVVLDCMDGSLARYRKASSQLGGFLDKLTDAIGFSAIFGALGWRAYLDTGDAFVIIVAMAIAISLLIRAYVFWVVAAIEAATGGKRSTGIDKRVDFSALSPRDRARLYLRSMGRIVEFAESDLYFWIGLGLLIGSPREMVYGLGIATGCWLVAILVLRLRTVVRIERANRSS